MALLTPHDTRPRPAADRLLALLAVAPGQPAWGRGLRLAAAMIVPLAAGVIIGQPTAGLLVGVGAFVVASTDTGGPYRPRAVTMIAATLGVTAAYFLGALTAQPRWLSAVLFVSVLAGSALIGTAGPHVAPVSTMVMIAFIIGAFLPSSPAADAGAALALLAGGGWALGLSLAGWPFDQRRPERRAVSAAIKSCAVFLGELDPAGQDAAGSSSNAREAARTALVAARQTLQASLPRGRSRMTAEVRRLWALLYATGTLFDAIVAAGRQLQAERPAVSRDLVPGIMALQAAVADAAVAVRAARTRDHPGSRRASASPAATLPVTRGVDDAVQALIALIADSRLDPGWMPPAASGPHWRAVVGAVSRPSPAVLRGAVRQAVAGCIALVIASLFDPAHGAWLVSSTVLVLKPNVSGTVSTALQRAAATVIGATIAAGIVAVTANQGALIGISFAAAALAMAVMPLSYSLGILIITPLSILLTTVLTGSGWLIAVSRAENILIGVAIAAVVSYALYPTWLRTSVPGVVAHAVDAIGRYLATVQPACEARAEDQARHDARSVAETSVASLRATAGQLGLEPGSGMLALVLGEASAAAARLLDTIIALKQVLDRTGPEQQASAVAAIIGHASDVLFRMSAAMAGPEPPTRAAADARIDHQRNPADAPATAAEGTPRGPGSAPAEEARGPQPVPLLFALEQLTEAIATFRGVLGRLPASATQICWGM